MIATWDDLLRKLKLSDLQVYDTVAQACRRCYRRRATEELCQAVFAEVYINLSGMLKKSPDHDYFTSPEKFRGAVRTTAWRVHGPDIRDRNRNAVQYQPPETIDRDASPDDDDPDWTKLRELVADCNGACQKCLFDAGEEFREVFRLRCEQIPVREIQDRLGLTEVTLWRRWGVARKHFIRNCGRGLEGSCREGAQAP